MNSLIVEEGVAVADIVALPVTLAAWLEAAECALDIALLIIEDTLLAAEEAAEEAAEAAEVTEATADEAAEVVSGISIGTPAASQVSFTAAIVVAWSSALQDF